MGREGAGGMRGWWRSEPPSLRIVMTILQIWTSECWLVVQVLMRRPLSHQSSGLIAQRIGAELDCGP